jgi:transcriptional regulator with PAS, ATPase and Fis domain
MEKQLQGGFMLVLFSQRIRILRMRYMQGNFEKIFFRINVLNLFIPSLKERKENILVLVEYILGKEKKEGDTKKDLPSSSEEVDVLRFPREY